MLPWLAWAPLALGQSGAAPPMPVLPEPAPSAQPAQSASGAPTPMLEPVQVSASRLPTPVFTTPGSVDVRHLPDAAAERPGINLSEALHGIPGLHARERQNLAQDLQVSIRGFGSRASFGIRGLRLALDGMPLTMPDGQGQVSNIPMAALSRVEVLRGPYSSLHGNAAGGVIQAFTANGADDPGLRLGLRVGADGLARGNFNLRGAQSGFDYHLDLAHSRIDGFRDHSAATRSSLHAKLRFDLPHAARLSLLANVLDQPEAQDPLGLDATQVREDPSQSVSAATDFDTRKAVRHQQFGLVLEPDGEDSGWRVLAYAGRREVRQFLSIPVQAQANPTSGGGVVDLAGGFAGLDARWRWHGLLADRDFDLVLGLSADRQSQHRRGFENFRDGQLGVVGRLRRDQQDRVSNLDQYLEASWQLMPTLSLRTGLRHSRVRFRSEDHYLAPGNPDDGGARGFSATSPVGSLGWQARQDLFVFAAWGRGFETPTFDELGYRPDGSAGLNFDLDAVRSRHLELGARLRRGAWRWQLALFRSRSDDELAVVANSGGRSSYANVGPSRRQGLELSLQWQPGQRWRHELAYARNDARTRQSYLTCAGTPCPVPNLQVPAGARMPGSPRDSLWLASRRQGERWHLAMDAELSGPVIANSAGTARAPGFLQVDATLARNLGEGRRLFLRVGNLLDRRVIGSVIVNEGNGRYFEPAPGRNLLLGLDWKW